MSGRYTCPESSDTRPCDRLAHGTRLLVDLLQHEVFEAPLLRHDRIPRDPLDFRSNGVALEIRDLGARSRQHRDFVVAEIEDVASVVEDRGDVGGDEVLVLTEADDDRRPLPHRDDLLWFVRREDREREEACHLRGGAPHGIFERHPVLTGADVLLDQVRDDLGVGLRHERVPFLGETAFDLQVVLDDAVVNDDDAAGAVAMGVRVLLGRTAMRRPPGVSESVHAVERLQTQRFFEVAEFTLGSPDVHRAAFVDDSDPGRVVAAILELLQAVHDDGYDLLPSDVSDDSTHRSFFLLGGSFRTENGSTLDR